MGCGGGGRGEVRFRTEQGFPRHFPFRGNLQKWRSIFNGSQQQGATFEGEIYWPLFWDLLVILSRELCWTFFFLLLLGPFCGLWGPFT